MEGSGRGNGPGIERLLLLHNATVIKFLKAISRAIRLLPGPGGDQPSTHAARLQLMLLIRAGESGGAFQID